MPSDDFADLLRGAQAIADYSGETSADRLQTKHQTNPWLETRHCLVQHEAEDSRPPAW